MKTNFTSQLIVGTFFFLAALLSMHRQASAQFTLLPSMQYSDFQLYLDDAPRSFDFFDAEATQDNTVNSYLLALLSDKIYTNALTQTGFRQQLEEEFGPRGLNVDHVFMNAWTGTDGAVLSNNDAVFIVFRGTSSNGSLTPWADYLGDVDVDMVQKTIAGKSFWAHKGFWNNVDSVLPGIRAVVAPQFLQGKRVWICGHSLGGANATIAGLRLHYEYKIDIQRIETFGAPKAGDSGLKAKFYDANEHGKDLVSRTTRWAMYNDPVHTFFSGAYIKPGYYFVWRNYQHVGQVNKIYAQSNGTFNFYLNSSDYPMTYQSIYGLLNEHCWYDEALEYKLRSEGFNYVIDGNPFATRGTTNSYIYGY